MDTRLLLRDAELRAAPLASEVALHDGLVDLDPSCAASDTRRLWRAVERDAVARAASHAIDEIVLLRDRTWFEGAGAGPIPLRIYLSRLAAQSLRPAGIHAEPLPDRFAPVADATARAVWRWRSFYLPSDLLIAALPEGDRLAARTRACTPTLTQRLDDLGYAETHLHLFAAMDFSGLWALTQWIAAGDLHDNDFVSPGAALDEGRHLARWLVLAALGRVALAAFLRTAADARRADAFDVFLAAWTQGFDSSGRLNEVVVRALRELASPCNAPAPYDLWALQAALAACSGVRQRRSSQTADAGALDALDPIAHLLPRRAAHATSEMRLVRAGLDHLAANGDDPRFARIFWQVVRVRALYFQHMIQRPLTPGLQWFLRAYGRMKPVNRDAPEALYVDQARRLGGRGLRSLELRTSPAETVAGVLNSVRTVADAARRPVPPGEPATEYALVFHIAKTREGGAERGAPAAFSAGSTAAPSNGACRYAKFYRSRERQCLALRTALTQHPAILTVFRGVDVCTDEAAVPTWVLAPLLRGVREVSRVVAREVSLALGWEVPPLRATTHAGEDFTHLTTGIRRVHESIVHYDLRAGDRLGHAVALGVRVDWWSERANRVLVEREERLFDLVWELSLYRQGLIEPRAGRGFTALEEALRHAHDVFGFACSDRDICELYECLHQPKELTRSGFPDGLRGPSDRKPDLLTTYLSSAEVFARARTPVEVDAHRERETVADLQRLVRREVGVRGLVVETNPSSNLLIGDLRQLERHPLWELRPPTRAAEDPVSVCIGSDDPLTFDTSLPSEYQLVSDALQRAGVAGHEAQEWLEHARRTGLDARFSLPRHRVLDPYALGALPEPA